MFASVLSNLQINHKVVFFRKNWLLCAFVWSSLAQAQDAVLQNAKELMGARKPEQAYTLLADKESTQAGNAIFDYLIGIAALDSGRVTRAIFALERVLAMQPDNALARAELGRAYLAAGEPDAARTQLQMVQAADIPAAARETVKRLLSIIDPPAATVKRAWRAYFETGLGYDTNVNSGSSVTQFAVPALGGLELNLAQSNQKTKDSVTQLGAGYSFRIDMNPNTELVGGFNARNTYPSKEHQLSSDQADGNLGVVYSKGDNEFSGLLNLSVSGFNGTRFRNVSGLSSQWRHSIDDMQQVGMFVQYAQIRYPNLQLRDVNRSAVGLVYGRSFGNALSGYVSASVGQEKNIREFAEEFAIRFWNIRVGGEQVFDENLRAFGSVSVERRQHKGEDAFFLTEQQDTQTDLTLGMHWLAQKSNLGSLRVTPQVMYSRVKSNVEIREFNRTQAGVTARLDF